MAVSVVVRGTVHISAVATRSEGVESRVVTQTWNKHFFCESENLGNRIWRKKCVNYEKNVIAQDCINQIFNPNLLVFFLLTGAT